MNGSWPSVLLYKKKMGVLQMCYQLQTFEQADIATVKDDFRKVLLRCIDLAV